MRGPFQTHRKRARRESPGAFAQGFTPRGKTQPLGDFLYPGAPRARERLLAGPKPGCRKVRSAVQSRRFREDSLMPVVRVREE